MREPAGYDCGARFVSITTPANNCDVPASPCYLVSDRISASPRLSRASFVRFLRESARQAASLVITAICVDFRVRVEVRDSALELPRSRGHSPISTTMV